MAKGFEQERVSRELEEAIKQNTPDFIAAAMKKTLFSMAEAELVMDSFKEHMQRWMAMGREGAPDNSILISHLICRLFSLNYKAQLILQGQKGADDWLRTVACTLNLELEEIKALGAFRAITSEDM